MVVQELPRCIQPLRGAPQLCLSWSLTSVSPQGWMESPNHRLRPTLASPSASLSHPGPFPLLTLPPALESWTRAWPSLTLDLSASANCSAPVWLSWLLHQPCEYCAVCNQQKPPALPLPGPRVNCTTEHSCLGEGWQDGPNVLSWNPDTASANEATDHTGLSATSSLPSLILSPLHSWVSLKL